MATNSAHDSVRSCPVYEAASCKNCSKEFVRYPSRKPLKEFCSGNCARAFYYRNRYQHDPVYREKLKATMKAFEMNKRQTNEAWRLKQNAESREYMKEYTRRPEIKQKKRGLDKQYRIEHRDRINEQHRKWYAEHREQLRERNKKYRVGHREQIREYWRKYSEINKEQLREYRRKYNRKHSFYPLIRLKYLFV